MVFTCVPTTDAQTDDEGVVTNRGGEGLVFHIDNEPGCEVYLYVRGLAPQKGDVLHKKCKVTVTGPDGKTKELSFKFSGEDCSWYYGRNDFLINAGYFEESGVDIKLTFPDRGRYNYTQISAVCQKLDAYPQLADKLAQDKADQIDTHVISAAGATDLITGDIEVSGRKVLCIALPYGPGWTIRVDGEEKQLLQVNTMFMGAVLEEGSHHIELRYRRPGGRAGLYVSAAGLVLLLLLVFIQRPKAVKGSLHRN